MSSRRKSQILDYSGALTNSKIRDSLYKRKDGCFMFENPIFSDEFVADDDDDIDDEDESEVRRKDGAFNPSSMRLKDFLASIPSFSDFTDEQLLSLETKATIKKYDTGDVIFRQGEEGDAFYVIHEGGVDVLIQENASQLKRGDLVSNNRNWCSSSSAQINPEYK